MSREQYAAFTEELTVRELQVGGRILVTTLLEPSAAPKGELAKLYERRWNIELDLRCIKTTLRMETLSCKSASMAVSYTHLRDSNAICDHLNGGQRFGRCGRGPESDRFDHGYAGGQFPHSGLGRELHRA